MSEIKRTSGDTYRVIMRLIDDNKKPILLTGWTNFRFVVDDLEVPTGSATRRIDVGGTIIDATKGRVSFIPIGTVPVGKYYFSASGIDSNGERITFKTGRYYVVPSLI